MTNALNKDRLFNAEVDQTYAKPLFTSLQITFEATNANRRFDNTLLDSGQWLARKSQRNVGTTEATASNSNLMVNYAFKYEGVYVDRPVALFHDAKAATNQALTKKNLLPADRDGDKLNEIGRAHV